MRDWNLKSNSVIKLRELLSMWVLWISEIFGPPRHGTDRLTPGLRYNEFIRQSLGTVSRIISSLFRLKAFFLQLHKNNPWFLPKVSTMFVVFWNEIKILIPLSRARESTVDRFQPGRPNSLSPDLRRLRNSFHYRFQRSLDSGLIHHLQSFIQI